MKNKILVTGGAGFIGLHLCHSLLKRGYTVYCIDNFISSKKENLKPLYKFKNFYFKKHDIERPLSIDVSKIYNLACPASPYLYQKKPIKTLKTNFNGVMNILDLAKKNKATVFQASTSEIYGDPVEHPQKETYFGNVNTMGERSCYDEGKRVAEALFYYYLTNYKLKIKVARIFNTYGPNMLVRDGRVISNFINQAINNDDITVYGDGNQTRSFCYVDDLIIGINNFINSKKSITGPLNLGNPKEYTIKYIAKKIIKLTESKSKIIYKNKPQDDPVKRKPDISKAKKELSFNPKTSLNEGLLKTIKYFKQIKE